MEKHPGAKAEVLQAPQSWAWSHPAPWLASTAWAAPGKCVAPTPPALHPAFQGSGRPRRKQLRWEQLQGGVQSVGSLTVVPNPAVALPRPNAASHPCSRLRPRLCFSGKGAARGKQRLTAPCFWQVPTSSTSASSCWSARIRPRPGLFPAACPRSPVSPPWPGAASSSRGSSRSRMRAKKPCQIKTSVRWTSDFPASTLWAVAGPVPGPRGGAGTVTSWLQSSLMLGMDMTPQALAQLAGAAA